MAARTRSVFDALGITSKRPGPDPPHDDVVEHRPVVVEQVGVLRPTRRDATEVVGERSLQAVERVGAFDAHGAEVADVEGDRRPRGTLGARRGCPPDSSAACPSRRTPPALRPARGDTPRGATHALAKNYSSSVTSKLSGRGSTSSSPASTNCARLLEPVLDEQVEVVALIKDLDLGAGVQRPELADLAVLLGDQLLVQRGDLDIEVIARQIEVGPEGLYWTAEPIPLEDELSRLVLPGDAVEVEEESELPL